MCTIHLRSLFRTSDSDLISIDDDDIRTIIEVGSIVDLISSRYLTRYRSSETSEIFSGCIDDEPFAFITEDLFCDESFHEFGCKVVRS